MTGELETVRLCHETDVAEGEARGFLPDPQALRAVIVVRREGRFHAYLDSCPHYSSGTPMAWRKDAYLSGDRKHIACHAHGALFEIDSGICVEGPCLGRSLTPVLLTRTEDGSLHAPIEIAEQKRRR